MKKLVFFSPIASPHQVRFCKYLRKYYDAEFFFYERCSGRQAFWAVPLEDHCHILPVHFKWHRRYCTLSVLKILAKFKPDILMMGGFSIPSNFFAYRWARKHGVKTIIQTERSRIMATGVSRPYDWKWKLLHWLYKDIDCIMTTAQDIVPQFRDTFQFGDVVVAGQYPSDIDKYYSHPMRCAKEAYTLIFPNRMTDIYNPIGAIDIFEKVVKRYPKTRLKMNAAGELRPQVEEKINKMGLSDCVEFLDNIKNWDDLSDIYRQCDIMYLPAKYSNGNYSICECAVSGMGCIISSNILGDVAMKLAHSGAGFVLPLEEDKFVEKICWYIEHPEAFQKDAVLNRETFLPYTFEATASLYHKILIDL